MVKSSHTVSKNHEKIILQDFTVLLVCPSIKWSTIERRVIFDSTFLRNMGCNPVILCREGSQIDLAAEVEDIPRVYIRLKRLSFLVNLKYYFELKDLLKENRFDLVHCYSITSTWLSSFLLKRENKTPLLYTLNHHLKTVYQGVISKWLLSRVDRILTLSEEVKDFAQETFPISNEKILNIGSGIEIVGQAKAKKEVKSLGCVVNDINELKRLRSVFTIFRVLKAAMNDKCENLDLCIFMGPRIYQKDKAKNLLTEFEYEFYENDIVLYSLEGNTNKLKEVDIFIGLAFDEPLNDFEVTSILNKVPILFPRTAMRQNILFRYSYVGESYSENDIREAKTKLIKIINNYPKYLKGLDLCYEEISNVHGLENYARELQLVYEHSFAERR